MSKRNAAAAAVLFLLFSFAGEAVAAPGGFTITNAQMVCTNTTPSLRFSWTVSAGATSYSVVRNGVTIVPSTTATSFDDPNVVSGTSYTYSVIASDGTGTTPSSNSVTMTAPYCTTPDPPTLTATLICQSANPAVRLNWTAAARATTYDVLRNGVPIRTNLPASTLTFTDTNVTVGTTYSYAVRAVNLAPSGPATSNTETLNNITNPCPPPPAAPAVSATASCGTAAGLPSPRVTVTWTAPSGATSYSLFRNNESLASSLTTNTYNDLNVNAGSSYTYVVYAHGQGGQSAPGSTSITVPANVCAPQPPSAPALQASNICTPSNTPAIQLSWTASTNATSYTLFRNGATIASGVTATQRQDTPVVGSSNTYVVRAVGEGGTADSAPVTITHTDVCPRPPGAFSSSVSVICSNDAAAVRVTWTSSSGATSYSVVRNGAVIASGLSGSSYEDRAVTDGSTYSYLVRAVNSHGSTETAPNSVTVADPCPRPPGSLTLSGRSFCSGNTAAVSLTWTAAARAVSYTVLRNGAAVATGVGGTSYQDTDVLPGNSYTYGVRALNANGSTDSNPFSVTPASCNTNTPRADLAVSNASLSRASADPGDTVEVSYTIANGGQGNAGETLTRIRVGTNQQPSASDAVVFTTATPPLAAGASRRESHTFTVPARLRGGTYFVFVSVNDDRAVDETTFTNNVAALRLEVAQTQCQLSCLVLAPTTATTGQPVTLALLETPACPVSVTWQLGNGTTASGESISAAYPQAGIYQWTVVVTGTGGGAGSCANAGTIEVKDPPKPARRRSVRH